MSSYTRSGQPKRKAWIAFTISLVVLWFGTAWAMTKYEQWLVASAQTMSLKERVVTFVATIALMFVVGILLVNLFGITIALIMPRRRLARWNTTLTKYYYTLCILRKFVDFRLKPRYWTP